MEIYNEIVTRLTKNKISKQDEINNTVFKEVAHLYCSKLIKKLRSLWSVNYNTKIYFPVIIGEEYDRNAANILYNSMLPFLDKLYDKYFSLSIISAWAMGRWKVVFCIELKDLIKNNLDDYLIFNSEKSDADQLLTTWMQEINKHTSFSLLKIHTKESIESAFNTPENHGSIINSYLNSFHKWLIIINKNKNIPIFKISVRIQDKHLDKSDKILELLNDRLNPYFIIIKKHNQFFTFYICYYRFQQFYPSSLYA